MKKYFVLALALLTGISMAAQNQKETDPDVEYAAEMLKSEVAAPDFTLNDIDGKPVRFSDFKGKNVVLIFWASWCPDCRAEVPVIQEMYASAPAEKVTFVSVSFDRKEEAFRNYVIENKLPGVQLFDAAGKKDSVIAADFHVKWIPALYLIGPDGKVKLGTVVADKVAQALKEL